TGLEAEHNRLRSRSGCQQSPQAEVPVVIRRLLDGESRCLPAPRLQRLVQLAHVDVGHHERIAYEEDLSRTVRRSLHLLGVVCLLMNSAEAVAQAIDEQ